MPPPKRTRNWTLVEQASTWQAGTELVAKFNDGGANPGASWRLLPGGEALSRRMFVCWAHVDCTREIRLVTKKTQEVWLEKDADEKHAKEVNVLNRSNAALTLSHKAEAKTGRAYGASPLEIMQRLATGAFNAGVETRLGPEAKGVTGDRPARNLPLRTFR